MSDLRALVAQDTLATYPEGDFWPLKASKRGELIVIDWYKQMAIEGRIYQVRAGTITTPLVGDVVITDTAAEMAIDALTTTATVIPVYLNIAVRLGTGTLHEYAVKSVAATQTAVGSTGFTPLNLLLGGGAADATLYQARVAAAGGVTVAVEVATTTRRHWAFSSPVAVGAGNTVTTQEWTPRVPPIIAGVGSAYVQIAATTTGPSYYAAADFIAIPTVNIS